MATSRRRRLPTPNFPFPQILGHLLHLAKVRNDRQFHFNSALFTGKRAAQFSQVSYRIVTYGREARVVGLVGWSEGRSPVDAGVDECYEFWSNNVKRVYQCNHEEMRCP